MTFENLDYNHMLTKHMINWRRVNISENVSQGSKPWELSKDHWELGLWKDIQSKAKWPLSKYLEKANVHKHLLCHNLKSSWIQAANLYFPFGQRPEGRLLFASFLKERAAPFIKTIDRLELEYQEAGDLHPSILLGEIGGQRGKGQTSPDIGIIANSGKSLVIIENKLSEKSFYRCPLKSACQFGASFDASELLSNPSKKCLLHKYYDRKYWKHLTSTINKTNLSSLKCCPAADGGYQLFRQQALCEGIASSRKYDSVVSCVAYDERNTELFTALQPAGISDFRFEWSQLFNSSVKFVSFSHQEWVKWVEEQSRGQPFMDWVLYIKERYGF